MSAKPSIFITGGAGYLGSILVPTLLARGHKVTVLDTFLFPQCQTSLSTCFANPNFAIIRGDCRDEGTLRPLVAGADVIIPLAALVGAPLCNKDKIGARTVNAGAIKTLLDIASPSQSIIMPVSNSGYGIGEKGKFCTEETPLRPVSLYGVTKVEAEKMMMDRGNCISFRLATVFGFAPRMRLDLLVNDFVYRAAYDRALVLFEPHFKRNFIHVRDVTNAFLHGLDNFELLKNNIFNVGLSEANLSKWELCERIQTHVKDFVFLEAPIGEDPDKRDYIVSNEKIEKTGYQTKHSLDSGITELLKGFIAVRNSSYANV